MVVYGTVRYGVWCGMCMCVWSGLVLSSMVRYGMVCYGMVWNDTV